MSFPPLPPLVFPPPSVVTACADCRVVLTPANSSKLTDGRVKHIGCIADAAPKPARIGEDVRSPYPGGPEDFGGEDFPDPAQFAGHPDRVGNGMIAALPPLLSSLPSLAVSPLPRVARPSIGDAARQTLRDLRDPQRIIAPQTSPELARALGITAETYAGCPPVHVLSADCPWKFDNKATRAAAEDHYSTLTLEDLKKFPLPPLQDDCVLFLWRVSSMVPEAYEVCKAWGFVPKSEITWIKTRPCKECKKGDQSLCDHCKGRGYTVVVGMGNYTRHATETAIIAVRGKTAGCKVTDRSILDIFYAHRTEHSEKPDKFYEIVQKLYPNGPHAELFARKRRPSWYCFGDELPREGA